MPILGADLGICIEAYDERRLDRFQRRLQRAGLALPHVQPQQPCALRQLGFRQLRAFRTVIDEDDLRRRRRHAGERPGRPERAHRLAMEGNENRVRHGWRRAFGALPPHVLRDIDKARQRPQQTDGVGIDEQKLEQLGEVPVERKDDLGPLVIQQPEISVQQRPGLHQNNSVKSLTVSSMA